jgi:hypothetical protein
MNKQINIKISSNNVYMSFSSSIFMCFTALEASHLCDGRDDDIIIIVVGCLKNTHHDL